MSLHVCTSPVHLTEFTVNAFDACGGRIAADAERKLSEVFGSTALYPVDHILLVGGEPFGRGQNDE